MPVAIWVESCGADSANCQCSGGLRELGHTEASCAAAAATFDLVAGHKTGNAANCLTRPA